MEERIQKWIAQSGLCSRRKAEELLLAGRVTVDGTTAHPGDKADAALQTICVDGIPIVLSEKKTYILLHKPVGYTCTLADRHAAHPVTELVADCGVRVYPVGRLDRDSEGLLLLTDDGDFMQMLTHPRHQVDKVYEVTVSGDLNDCEKKLAAVSDLDGEPIIPAQVVLLEKNDTRKVLQVTIHQGKNRQIRRMCARVGLQVQRLRRVREDSLTLGALPEGHWRYLTEEEINSLKGSGNT